MRYIALVLSVVGLGAFALLCGWYAANDEATPAWNPGDIFGSAFSSRSAR